MNNKGDAVAVSDGDTQLSWDELDQAVVYCMTQLHSSGCRPGDRVGLLMKNSSQAIPWVLASISAGLWLVPVSWHLTDAEQQYIAEDSQMRLLISSSEYRNRDLRCPHLDASLLDAGLSSAEDFSTAVRNADSPAGGIMLYTSGTTGRPKGVQRRSPETLGELCELWRSTGVAMGLDGGVHLVTGPIYHAAPLLFALYDLLNGASLVLMPRFDATQALRIIDEYGVNHSHWVPTMLVRALRLPPEVRRSFSGESLTLLLHGAAPIAASVKREIIDWWGPLLVEYWGASESGAVCRCSSQQWLEHPGTVGKVLPQYEVFAYREGRRLPEGETGLLGIRPRSGLPAFSYWNDPEKTEQAYIENAVFQLGDIGYVRDGFVYLKDRESHTVISGGVNIYPAEVEAVLLQQDRIADVVVFGIPDAEWGERLIAVVELVDGCPPESARAELSEQILREAAAVLASFKLPRQVYFAAVERNAAGKVPLARLRSDYALI